jgi:hypothetical protein
MACEDLTALAKVVMAWMTHNDRRAKIIPIVSTVPTSA